MINKTKISIIMPVYGVEKYIEKCLESILAQSFKEFECLIVNDGTKDTSIEVAKKLVGSDSRFVFLDKENGGQGSAKNMGLDHVKGDYIAFIDSDDYVEPRYLQAMYEKCKIDDLDICTCDVRYVDIVGNTVRLFNNYPDAYLENNDYLMAEWYVSNFMCDKLFKSEIFQGVYFNTELKTNEDVYLLFEILYGKKISSVSGYLYNYVQRPSATSKGAPASFIDDRVKIINKQLDFSRSLDKFEKDIDYISLVYMKHFLSVMIVTVSRYSNDFRNDIVKVNRLFDAKFFNYRSLSKLSVKYPKTVIVLLLYRISPSLFKLVAKYWFRNYSA